MIKNPYLQVQADKCTLLYPDALDGSIIPECEPNDCGVLCTHANIIIADCKDKYLCFYVSKNQGRYYFGCNYMYSKDGGGSYGCSVRHGKGYYSISEGFLTEVKKHYGNNSTIDKYFHTDIEKIVKQSQQPIQLTLNLF